MLLLACWLVSLVWLYRSGVIGPSGQLPSRRSPIVAIDGLASIFLVLGGSTVYGVVLGRLAIDRSSGEVTLAAATLGGQLAGLGVASVYAWLLMVRGEKVELAPESRIGWILGSGCVLTVTLGMGTSAVVAGLGTLAGYPPPAIAHEALQRMVDFEEPAALVLRLVSALVLAPVLEEVVFRGVIQRSIQDLLGHRVWRVWGSIVLTSVLFGVIHIGAVSWYGLPGLVVLGVIFGWLYARTGRLWVAVVAHVFFNALNVAMAFVLYGGGRVAGAA